MSPRTTRRGRPKTVDVRAVVRLRRDPARYTWAQIGERLGIHPDTAMREFKKAQR